MKWRTATLDNSEITATSTTRASLLDVEIFSRLAIENRIFGVGKCERKNCRSN
jgi:hypothetical protein